MFCFNLSCDFIEHCLYVLGNAFPIINSNNYKHPVLFVIVQNMIWQAACRRPKEGEVESRGGTGGVQKQIGIFGNYHWFSLFPYQAAKLSIHCPHLWTLHRNLVPVWTSVPCIICRSRYVTAINNIREYSAAHGACNGYQHHGQNCMPLHYRVRPSEPVCFNEYITRLYYSSGACSNMDFCIQGVVRY